MPRAFIYCRKSPCPESIAASQSGGSIDSLTQQETLCREKAVALGLEVIAVAQEHESAAMVPWSKRPGFVDLLAQMHAGDHLVVWRLDRLESNYMRLMELLGKLIDAKVEIHVLQFLDGAPVDLSSAMGRVMVGILAMARDMWIDMIRQATKDAYRVRTQGGQAVSGHAPFGRKFVAIDRPITRNPNRNMQLVAWDAHQCDLLRELLYRKDIMKEGWTSIAWDWIKRQELTQNGKHWAKVRTGSQRKLQYMWMVKALNWYREYRAMGRDLPTGEQIAEMPWTTCAKYPPAHDGVMPYLAASLGLNASCASAPSSGA